MFLREDGDMLFVGELKLLVCCCFVALMGWVASVLGWSSLNFGTRVLLAFSETRGSGGFLESNVSERELGFVLDLESHSSKSMLFELDLTIASLASSDFDKGDWGEGL